MRITAMIMATAVLLAAPATANAITGQYGEYPAPTGSICKDGVCFEIAQAGHIAEGVYVNGDYEMVHRKYQRWLFNDIPDEDKGNMPRAQEAIYNEIRKDGVVVSTQTGVSALSTSWGVVDYCNFYRKWNPNSADRVGLDRTPDSVMLACSFTRREHDPAPSAPEPPQTPVATTIPVPASAARCGAVSGSGGRVVVRSSRHSCRVARIVVARYARSLRSPAGWRCTALVKDTGLRARCVRKPTGRASVRSAVYGIWIRR